MTPRQDMYSSSAIAVLRSKLSSKCAKLGSNISRSNRRSWMADNRGRNSRCEGRVGRRRQRRTERECSAACRPEWRDRVLDSVHRWHERRCLFRNTLLNDRVDGKEEALLEVYKRLRPGDPPTAEAATIVSTTYFQSRSLRPQCRWSHENQRATWSRHSARKTHARREGHLCRRCLLAEAQTRQWRNRRHRQSRQSSGARCWRTAGEPIPYRLATYRTSGAGALAVA